MLRGSERIRGGCTGSPGVGAGRSEVAAAERTAGDGYTVCEVCPGPSVQLSARGLSQVVADGPSLCQSTGKVRLDGKVRAEEC